jgi:hypothetical protein
MLWPTTNVPRHLHDIAGAPRDASPKVLRVYEQLWPEHPGSTAIQVGNAFPSADFLFRDSGSVTKLKRSNAANGPDSGADPEGSYDLRERDGVLTIQTHLYPLL